MLLHIRCYVHNKNKMQGLEMNVCLGSEEFLRWSNCSLCSFSRSGLADCFVARRQLFVVLIRYFFPRRQVTGGE